MWGGHTNHSTHDEHTALGTIRAYQPIGRGNGSALDYHQALHILRPLEPHELAPHAGTLGYRATLEASLLHVTDSLLHTCAKN